MKHLPQRCLGRFWSKRLDRNQRRTQQTNQNGKVRALISKCTCCSDVRSAGNKCNNDSWRLFFNNYFPFDRASNDLCYNWKVLYKIAEISFVCDENKRKERKRHCARCLACVYWCASMLFNKLQVAVMTFGTKAFRSFLTGLKQHPFKNPRRQTSKMV